MESRYSGLTSEGGMSIVPALQIGRVLQLERWVNEWAEVLDFDPITKIVKYVHYGVYGKKIRLGSLSEVREVVDREKVPFSAILHLSDQAPRRPQTWIR